MYPKKPIPCFGLYISGNCFLSFKLPNDGSNSFFTFFSDQALTNFIDASLIPFGNQFKLRFPKRWELEIYKSIFTLDPFIWDNLHSLDSKLIVIAGEKSNTFLHSARKKLKPYCSSFITLPNTSHLLPFEVPKRLANIIIEHS